MLAVPPHLAAWPGECVSCPDCHGSGMLRASSPAAGGRLGSSGDQVSGDGTEPDEMAVPPPRWYAVYTRAQAEFEAARNLKRQGYWYFLPIARRTVKHGRKVSEAERPVLPRYLFIGLRPWEQLGPVYSTIGVATVVHLGGEPLRIPGPQMDRLIERLDEQASRAGDAGEPLLPGEPVRIVDGAFEGFVGEIARLGLDQDGRIRVWLNLFGRTTEAVVPAASLVRLSAVSRRSRWRAGPKRGKTASPGLR